MLNLGKTIPPALKKFYVLYTSLHLSAPLCTSFTPPLHLPCTSLHLLAPPYTSLHLPTPPCTSLHLLTPLYTSFSTLRIPIQLITRESITYTTVLCNPPNCHEIIADRVISSSRT